MRIPPSTIVMTLVTCVPFGLAIRATVGAPKPTIDDLMRGEPDNDEEAGAQIKELEQQMAAESARQAEESNAARANRERVRGLLFGQAPAGLGEGFHGLQVGSADDGTVDAEITSQFESGGIHVDLARAGDHLVQVRATLDDDCSELASELEARWGGGTDHLWVDTASGRRASLDDCTLSFERYVDVAPWIKALPTKLIGTSATKLRDALGAKVDDEGSSNFSWHDLGPGPAGTGSAGYLADIENGKVASITVTADVRAETGDQIRAQLAKQFGEPKTDPDTDLTVYKSRPPITVDGHSGQISLQLGRLP